jgi:hypothetical protein
MSASVVGREYPASLGAARLGAIYEIVVIV